MKRFYPFLLLCAVLLLAGALFAQTGAPAPNGTSTPPNGIPTQPANDNGASAPGASSSGSADPLLDPPPMPKTPVTLVGGVVTHIDRIRNKLAVQPYGSGKVMKMIFDERTHFYRDGREITMLGIKEGDRVYVDTQLDGDRIFARNVRAGTAATAADASGQVLSYDLTRDQITIQDQLSSQPVTFWIDEHTVVKRADGSGSIHDLVPGSLVAVRFLAGARGRGLAQEITLIAVPGSVFTFSGKVMHLDVSIGLLSIESATDNKRYDLYFTRGTPGFNDHLTEGSDVTVQAVFEGYRYSARSITLNQASNQ